MLSRKTRILLGALGLAVLVIFFIMEPAHIVMIGKTTIRVEVADTQSEREQGLSGRSGLNNGEGMLLVFESENSWGIWMKDMRFPIDIVWADSEGGIISIEHDVSPATYPQAFYPRLPRARYVLEVPAGFVKAHTISEGMKLEYRQAKAPR